MNGSEARQRDDLIDGLVEGYEGARAAGREVDLCDLLPAADHPLYAEVRRELLRVDLEWSWADGRGKRLRDYVATFPGLLDDHETVQEVAFEEYRLRLVAGETPDPAGYAAEYGVSTAGWATVPAKPAASSVFSSILRRGWCDSRSASRLSSQASGSAVGAMTTFPGVGATFLGFRLIDELGRGTFGRVYLARQGDLADRLVALKITVGLRDEDQRLAQLQHTNVVPAYSAHRAGPFHAVCMPFFGPTTLADVIRAVHTEGAAPTSGRAIVETLDQRRRDLLARLAPDERACADDGTRIIESPARRRLAEASFVDAVLWIGERVAEGLSHAHDHGILHRDIKPENVLLTDDGEPMLLDFNLSSDVKRRAGLAELDVGGTLPYMAPEQIEVMRGGTAVADARSDVYSLGVVLFELLTGRRSGEEYVLLDASARPGADRWQAPPPVRRWNPAATPAVESIVRQCLQPDPARRYQSAWDLRDDLHRQRHDRPLRHAPEPSLRERARKWKRRHPRLTSPTTLAAALVLAAAVALAAWLWQAWGTADGRANRAEVRADQADEKAARVAEDARVREEALGEFRASSNRATAATRSGMGPVALVHTMPRPRDELRPLFAEAAEGCRGCLRVYHVLDEPNWATRVGVAALPDDERVRLMRRVTGLLHAVAQAELDIAPPDIDVAERLNRPAYDALADEMPPADDVDAQCWDALAAAAEGDRATTTRLATEVTGREPEHRAAWLLRALSQHDSNPGAAEAAYNVYFSLGPGNVVVHYARGRLYLSEKRWPQAEGEFDHVLALRPGWVTAWLNRAYARLGRGDDNGAVADYTAAIRLAPDLPALHYRRALVWRKLGKDDQAAADEQTVLTLPPATPDDWATRGILQLRREPQAALADFERAVELDFANGRALLAKADLLAKSPGRERETPDALNRLLGSNPAHGDGRSQRGALLARLGNRDAAVADAEELLRRDPGPANCYEAAAVYAQTARLQWPADSKRAIELLAYALRSGCGVSEYETDPRLRPLAKHPTLAELSHALTVVGTGPAPRMLSKRSGSR